MSTPSEPRKEYAGTYFVQDRSSKDELARLLALDQMFTTGMGGVLPEQPDPASFQRILDVGCGTGGWLLETAKTYPSITTLVGGDVSSKMLDYARTQAQAHGLSHRVEFQTMDALLILTFPTSYFDLVNHRSAVSWLRTWDWPKLLGEYRRVVRPHGLIRVTENDMPGKSSSPALTRLLELALRAFHQAGHFFAPDENGATSQLADVLRRHGIQDVQTRDYTITYGPERVEGRAFIENLALAFKTMVPFLQKWIQVPGDYEALYQQMLSDIQRPDFVATVHLQTAWGTNPPKD